MNKTIIEEIEKKEKAEILDIEIKSFSKNLVFQSSYVKYFNFFIGISSDTLM